METIRDFDPEHYAALLAKRWLVAHCQPHGENKAQDALVRAGYTRFVPIRRQDLAGAREQAHYCSARDVREEAGACPAARAPARNRLRAGRRLVPPLAGGSSFWAEGKILGGTMLGILIAIIPIGMGLFLWWFGYKASVASRAQAQWISTQGVIRTSSISKKEVDLPILGRVTTRSTGWTARGLPDVTYEYQVNGQTFTGSAIGTPPLRRKWGASPAGDKGDLAFYEAGRAVTVFYDPASPSTAVLHRAPASGCALGALFLVGALFVTFGLIAWGIVSSLG